MDNYTNTNKDVAGFNNLTKFDAFMQNHRYTDPAISGYTFMFMTKPLLFFSFAQPL